MKYLGSVILSNNYQVVISNFENSMLRTGQVEGVIGSV